MGMAMMRSGFERWGSGRGNPSFRRCKLRLWSWPTAHQLWDLERGGGLHRVPSLPFRFAQRANTESCLFPQPLCDTGLVLVP